MGYVLENKLYNLLDSVRKKVPGSLFTGIGIVVYESMDELPYFPLNEYSEVYDTVELSNILLEGSLATNINHDGFNLINSEFKITHRNVYFSPPILGDVSFDKSKGYGTRYAAAILGSKIKGVLMTAIVSNSYGIVVFKNGQVIKRENNA